MEDFRPGTGGIFGDIAAVGLVTGMDNPPTDTNNPAGSLLHRSQPAVYIEEQICLLFEPSCKIVSGLWMFLSVPVPLSQETSVA